MAPEFEAYSKEIAERKLRILMNTATMAVDRAHHLENQLIICRQMLSEALAERDAERARANRLGVQLWKADSLHLCAGAKHRCYTDKDVLQDAGEGGYGI